MGKINEILASRQPPGINGLSGRIRVEDDPLNTLAVLDLSIPDEEYDGILQDYLEKNPHKNPVDEHDVFDYQKAKRENAGGDVAFDDDKYLKQKDE